MRKLFLFMMVSLDGYFEGEGHDLSWHNVDDEFVQFAIGQTGSVDTILFGRRTYEMMADFWPGDYAHKTDPVTAKLMNETPKVVFSHTLNDVIWQNSRLVTGDVKDEVTRIKLQRGKDMAVYGSNNLCLSLLKYGLLDELRIMVNPVVIGKGTPLFAGIDERLNVELIDTRPFRSGNVLLTYKAGLASPHDTLSTSLRS